MIQYTATLSPSDGSFLTQVTPAVRASLTVLFDLVTSSMENRVSMVFLNAVEETLKDPRLSINKTYGSRVRRMVYELSLVHPGRFFGTEGLEALQKVIKTRKGDDLTASRPGTCRSPWVRSLTENVLKAVSQEVTEESFPGLLKDWIVLTRKDLENNRQLSDFKELAEIVLARFDSMSLFRELIGTIVTPKTIEVDSEKVEEALAESAPAPSVTVEEPETPIEEFLTDGQIHTARPSLGIYPGYELISQRNRRTWDKYEHMVVGPHRICLDEYEGNYYLTILTAGYRDEQNRVVSKSGKIVYKNIDALEKEVVASDFPVFIRIRKGSIAYTVRSYMLRKGYEYTVKTWTNILGQRDTDEKSYRISFYQEVATSGWVCVSRIQTSVNSALSLWYLPTRPVW